MKNIFTIVALIILTFSLEASLLKAEKVYSYTKQELESFYETKKVPKFLVDINYDIDVYKLVHELPGIINGKITTASGLLFIPVGVNKPLPLASYQHGTTIKRSDAPSHRKPGSGETVVGMGMAADGYIVAMPDYMGLGDGPGFHPYIHAETEAISVIEFLRASKEFLKQLNIETNNQLFLFGYSQGGHATMAAHKMIQEKFSDEFTVTASAPMSGPYDVSGVQAEIIVQGHKYSHPGYLPYLLLGYNAIYNFIANPSDVFKSPYDSIIPPMYDGEHSMREINNMLPEVPAEIIKEEVLVAYKADPNHYFNLALKDNDVYDWKPEAPVRMCYCKGDEQVYWRNTIVAYETMQANGAKQVKKLLAGKKFDHGKCAIFSFAYTKMWFDSFRDGSKKGRKGPFFKRFAISMGKLFMKKK